MNVEKTMNNTKLQYRGELFGTITKHGIVVKQLSTHNAGNAGILKLFALAVSGHIELIPNHLPKYVDIQVSGQSKSYKTIPVSGLRYEVDSNGIPAAWFDFVVTSENLLGEDLNNVSFVVYDNSGEQLASARFEQNQLDGTKLTQGMQLNVSWRMHLEVT